MSKLNEQIQDMSDMECLELTQTLIRDRVKVGTCYLMNEETGLYENYFLVIECGQYTAASEPRELAQKFLPITGNENEVVN